MVESLRSRNFAHVVRRLDLELLECRLDTGFKRAAMALSPTLNPNMKDGSFYKKSRASLHITSRML